MGKIEWLYNRISYIPRLLYYLLLVFLVFVSWNLLKWLFRSFIKYPIKDWRYGRQKRKLQEKKAIYGE